VTLPFYIKKYLTAKEELWKLKYFTMQENIIFKKKKKSFKKRNQKASRYHNSLTNLKFQQKAKILLLFSFKNPHIKKTTDLLP